jgi:hypothetical protein
MVALPGQRAAVAGNSGEKGGVNEKLKGKN